MIVKVSELLQRVTEIANDGYEYVEVMSLDADEEFDMPAALSFSAIESEYSQVDYDSVDAVEK